MILGSRQLTLATVAMADGTQLTLATVAISLHGRLDGSHIQLTIANDFSSISFFFRLFSFIFYSIKFLLFILAIYPTSLFGCFFWQVHLE